MLDLLFEISDFFKFVSEFARFLFSAGFAYTIFFGRSEAYLNEFFLGGGNSPPPSPPSFSPIKYQMVRLKSHLRTLGSDRHQHTILISSLSLHTLQA